jgi:hypothetical protein
MVDSIDGRIIWPKSYESWDIRDTVYTCATTDATISSVTLCNPTAAAKTFRLSIHQAGATIDNKMYLYYGTTIPANDTFVATLGITMYGTDELRVMPSAATINVNVFGIERN